MLSRGNSVRISSRFALVTAAQTCEGHASSETSPRMSNILLLFVLGIVLLFLDLFVPGIILSVAGTFAFLTGTWQAFEVYGTVGGMEAFGVGLVLLGGMLYLEYGILPKTPFGKKFFLHAHVKGSSQEASDVPVLIGRDCVALTPLVPTGQVEIDGRRYEALSLDGHAERGTHLKVTGTQNFSLTVTKIS